MIKQQCIAVLVTQCQNPQGDYAPRLGILLEI